MSARFGDIEHATMTASERINFSRARLRAAMSPPPAPAAGIEPGPVRWLQRIKQVPMISLVLESFDAWWKNHPLHAAGQVAAQASNAVVQPVARRHPLALISIAGALGALLVWSRPWRWALRPALLAGLATQLASRVIANLPIESWMTLLGAVLSKSPSSPAAGMPSSAPQSASSESSTAAPTTA